MTKWNRFGTYLAIAFLSFNAGIFLDQLHKAVIPTGLIVVVLCLMFTTDGEKW